MSRDMRHTNAYLDSFKIRTYLLNYEFVDTDGLDYNKVYEFLKSVSVEIDHPTTSTFIVQAKISASELGEMLIEFTSSELGMSEKDVRLLIIGIPLDPFGDVAVPWFGHNFADHSTGEE